MLPENMQRIVLLNPLTRMLEAVRMGLISGNEVTTQNFVDLFPIVILCILFLGLGILFFRKRVVKIAEHF
jgi:ABC-type polysaccharide/polyol phosphate export permease